MSCQTKPPAVQLVRFGNTMTSSDGARDLAKWIVAVFLAYGEFRYYRYHRAPVFFLLFTGGGSS